MAEVTMPRLSDTMTEGTIARWLKHPGDPVEKGDVLLEIETDKATMELQAYESGVMEKILVKEGQTVPIGQPIAAIGDGSHVVAGGGGAATAAPSEAPSHVQVTSTEPSGAGQDTERIGAAPLPSGTPAVAGAPAAATAPGGEPAANGEVRASPMARRIARERGIDLAAIQGSGPHGRVIREDVERAATRVATPVAAPAPVPQPSPTVAPPTPPSAAPSLTAAGPDQEIEEIPLNNIKRITGQRMVESLQSAPHFFLTAVVDMTDLLALRTEINDRLAAGGEQKVSVNDLIVKASALALRAVPEANASFGGDKILRKKRIHVGVAVPTDRGLMVPVIRDADQKSVGQIARETRALIDRARQGKLTPAEFTGGTFTVSNLGMFGIEHFTAVINVPEAAILAVGGAAKEPVVVGGEIKIRDRMRVTLSVDHRVLDGADGARYLQKLTSLLEAPMRLLVQ
ncbi:MAG: 2-oxo acid dehydrogenase subunit E2 [Chloroflexi bacterium]|nr:2-oxo acid dehydrogenase subunit E2 [Chloroflexota bacterium]